MGTKNMILFIKIIALLLIPIVGVLYGCDQRNNHPNRINGVPLDEWGQPANGLQCKITAVKNVYEGGPYTENTYPELIITFKSVTTNLLSLLVNEYDALNEKFFMAVTNKDNKDVYPHLLYGGSKYSTWHQIDLEPNMIIEMRQKLRGLKSLEPGDYKITLYHEITSEDKKEFTGEDGLKDIEAFLEPQRLAKLKESLLAEYKDEGEVERRIKEEKELWGQNLQKRNEKIKRFDGFPFWMGKITSNSITIRIKSNVSTTEQDKGAGDTHRGR